MRRLLAVCLLASPAAAQVIEDFEHGNEALYPPANAGNDTMNITAAAARDGMFGCEFVQGVNPTWRSRLDLNTAPGNTYECYVRARGGSGTIGRSYLGVGATASGAYSAVFAPNTSTIILQNNANWGFVTVTSVPFSFLPDTWYTLRLEWAANGDMTVHLLDEAGALTLASTPTASTGYVTPGGVALRGFTTSASIFHDIDTIRGPAATIGSSYCGPAVVNSSGNSGAMSASGSAVVASNDLTIEASGLPLGANGYFLTSMTQGFVPNPGGSQGNLCLSGNIGRFVNHVFNTGMTGDASHLVDLTQMPTPGGLAPAMVGETWSFQAWFRDLNPGVTSNFTDGLEVLLL